MDSRGHHDGSEGAKDKPEPTVAQLLAELTRQNEERKIEREEKRAEKLARREAEAARRAEEDAKRHKAQEQESPDPGLDRLPPLFLGIGDIYAVGEWLVGMDMFMEAKKYSKEAKVYFASMQLGGEAHTWWKAELLKYQALGVAPTWEQFSMGFMEKYYLDPRETQDIPPHQPQQPVQQPQQRSDQRSGRIICNFCKRSGHTERDCRRANHLCLACGSADHRIASCPTWRPTFPRRQRPFAPASRGTPAAGQFPQAAPTNARAGELVTGMITIPSFPA